ncbi:bifunctional diguanylate cyclase/phosphodiesterase [Vibrio sp. ZSDE26]|uniref:Bifunctional diguanylate cyclase/phosphodiesterase n=1 Tax=Vibrio amylolyticus TaxID=2847292 RepID=A0A9X2BGC1_9VIBR|nr:bifunctional diguanylate cyclase/phosphodiesterase [Vibrio amylolyticus]MCK6261725.1 bifunctional diguanylate cyclase/phosphodiesterase [Vibrio amylolyticus]
MANVQRICSRVFSIDRAIQLAFVFAIAVVTRTLFVEHDVARWVYLLFPVLMFVAYLSKNRKVKVVSAIGSLALILVGGLIEPLELDAIEESFILLPLCYIVIFPGSLWPIASSLLIILSYLHHLPAEEFEEFIEDAIEIFLITSFATVMTYYQVRLRYQMLRYKKDSLTDLLTGLPNRKAFFNDLKDIETRPDIDYALFHIDLDGFKSVNDSLGHSQGDKLLKAFAQRVSGLLYDFNDLYRLGGDEFAIIVQGQNDLGDRISDTEHQLRNKYTPRFMIDAIPYKLGYSIGVALLEDAMRDTDLWCKNADIAVNKAKLQGKNCIQWYDADMLDETIREHQIEKELSRATEEKQFVLVYQPKVECDSNKVIGAEALIRWIHPELGIISPLSFIPIAEKSTLIIPIGRWVIRAACIQAKEWLDSGHRLSVSVNVSTVQFVHDDVYKVVSSELEGAGLPAELLEIEITETALMTQPERVISTCEKLRKLGVKVAIDDFGVAYSSLNYLKQLPIDILKIDKSFIDDCVTQHTDRMLVRTIIQMGHNLGKVVVAEGVEDQEQLALLKEEHCDIYQGYLYSKPLYQDEFNLQYIN